MQLSDLDVARARYLIAADDCARAFDAYIKAGGEKECIAFFRMALPAPDGHWKTSDGLLNLKG